MKRGIANFLRGPLSQESSSTWLVAQLAGPWELLWQNGKGELFSENDRSTGKFEDGERVGSRISEGWRHKNWATKMGKKIYKKEKVRNFEPHHKPIFWIFFDFSRTESNALIPLWRDIRSSIDSWPFSIDFPAFLMPKIRSPHHMPLFGNSQSQWEGTLPALPLFVHVYNEPVGRSPRGGRQSQQEGRQRRQWARMETNASNSDGLN